MMTDHHEPYFVDIQRFLANPANADVKDLYHEIVDELRSKLACHRESFESFEDFLNWFADTARERSPEKMKRKVLNVLLSFMYISCDIGVKE